MLSEDQIEKLSTEFKEILRNGNTKELKSFYAREGWVMEQGKALEQMIFEEIENNSSKKKPVRNAKKN